MEDLDENLDTVTGSLMETFALKVMKRLQEECRKQRQGTNNVIPDKDKWLLKYLRNHGFWIPSVSVPFLYCELFGKNMNHDDRFYYRDIRIWLPEEQYNVSVPCSNCGFCNKTRSMVGQHNTLCDASSTWTHTTASCLSNTNVHHVRPTLWHHSTTPSSTLTTMLA